MKNSIFCSWINLAQKLWKWCPIMMSAVAAAGLFTALSPAPAQAQLTACNQTLVVLNVALGYAEGDSFKTEGWWSVGANRCSDLVKKPLSDRYYYIYAEDVFGQPVLVGDVKACVDSKKFLVTDTTDCWTRGFRQANFSEVDTQSQDSWTVFIREEGKSR